LPTATITNTLRSINIAKSEDDNGEMQFDADEVAKYKELAERFGGL